MTAHPTRRDLLQGASGFALLATLAPGLGAAVPDATDIANGFGAPPPQASPNCYWYWISQNISKTGITHDLEAMRAVGIGEAYIGIIQDKAPTGPVPILSDPFWEAMTHAVEEGGRIGVGVSMFNSPGWSQSGGPWIPPDKAMRYIASSEIAVRGPTRISTTIPAPGAHFQPVATYAVPAPQADGTTLRPARIAATPALADPARLFDPADDRGCAIDASLVGTVGLNEGRAFQEPSSPGQGEQVIAFEIARPMAVRSLSLEPLPIPFRASVRFEAEVDGEWRIIEDVLFDRHNDWLTTGPMTYGPLILSFATVTARRFRLRFSRIGGEAGCGLRHIRLSPAARVAYAIEKQLGKMHQDPSPDWDSYMYPATAEPEARDLVIDPEKIVDLSDHVDADGTLHWSAPAGDWIVIRSGMLPTGVRNAPAPPIATGLDVDKMNPAALEYHFDRYVGEMLRRLGPATARKNLRQVIADSYETGPQNWTDGFEIPFRARYGYDPRPWLPALTGRIIGSAERTDRFLWDLRRLVADMIATHYVGALRKISARHGLGLWLENYGHWGFPSEFLEYGGQSDRISGEFWVDGNFSGELDAAVSASALYGKRIVSAEAFTAFAHPKNAWQKTPARLKRRGDWAFARGINHFVLHVYIHQPYDDRKPGINAWFDTEFNRHNTWFLKAKAWFDYLRRSSFLLQQGRLVAELGYYIGEGAPIMIGPLEPPPPPGYHFVHVNRDAILNRLTIREGRFVLPDGQSFAILILPPNGEMTPEVAQKLSALVGAGGIVAGPLPDRSPSLADYPAADARVARAIQAIRSSGRWYDAPALPSAIEAAHATPSLLDPPANLHWTHRRLDDGDLVFLSNQGDAPLAATLDLLAPSGTAMLLDAVTGLATAVPMERHGARIRVPLHLPVDGAAFLIVRRTIPIPDGRPLLVDGRPSLPLLGLGRRTHRQAASPLADAQAIALDGPWRVSTGKDEACPFAFSLERLESLDRSADARVRQFAGDLWYEAEVQVGPMDRGGGALLSLGDVSAIAEIEVNGIPCGTAWARPWLVEIGHALRPGHNHLRIRVTIGWHNRLAAAQTDPAGFAHCGETPWLAIPMETDGSLEPTGLLGPVSVRLLRPTAFG
jgi:hypothetical protein